MATKLFVSVLSVLLLSTLAFAVREGGAWQRGECQIRQINAQEPAHRIQAEGGESEYWNINSDEFQCAGVSLHRHTIRSRGLMLPSYNNAPVLVYVLQGRGIHGVLISGCPETYESSQSSQQFEGRERERESEGGRRFRDRHQKIGHFRQGDILAIPAGAAHWAYNDGDEELVVVVMQDNTNNANQLDQNPRSFYLAGNPGRSEEQQQEREYGQQGSRRGQHELGNVFRGFDNRVLSEIFQVDEETVRKMRGENDERGHIVIVERGLQVIRPPVREQEQEQEREYGRRDGANGLEETICSAKLRENIDNPSRADIYNPRAGRFSTVNSLTLPVLNFLQLSAAKGVLYRNAIMSPHWCVNAHSVIYATRGEAQLQIVNHRGQAVFNGQLRRGQVVVVPQNFAVVKRAGEQGFEWVEFNTNNNAMINTLSGRTSALAGLPVSVVANAYQISNEEAQRIKYSREETLLFSGSSRSERETGRAASA